jgi:hypothetical protein
MELRNMMQRWAGQEDEENECLPKRNNDNRNNWNRSNKSQQNYSEPPESASQTMKLRL